MERKQIHRINSERLQGWSHKLTDSHATAQVILGIHNAGGKEPEGKCIVLTTHDIPLDHVLLLAKEVVRQIEKSIAINN